MPDARSRPPRALLAPAPLVAARLLADSGESIAELAYRLNFQSLSRFYHLFRKQYSCTPAEYRKRALAARRLL